MGLGPGCCLSNPYLHTHIPTLDSDLSVQTPRSYVTESLPRPPGCPLLSVGWMNEFRVKWIPFLSFVLFFKVNRGHIQQTNYSYSPPPRAHCCGLTRLSEGPPEAWQLCRGICQPCVPFQPAFAYLLRLGRLPPAQPDSVSRCRKSGLFSIPDLGFSSRHGGSLRDVCSFWFHGADGITVPKASNCNQDDFWPVLRTCLQPRDWALPLFLVSCTHWCLRRSEGSVLACEFCSCHSGKHFWGVTILGQTRK